MGLPRVQRARVVNVGKGGWRRFLCLREECSYRGNGVCLSMVVCESGANMCELCVCLWRCDVSVCVGV